MKKVNFSYAIFDMDGTLLDSMHIWRKLPEYYLRSKGFVPPPGINQTVWAVGLHEAAHLFQNMGVPGTEDEIIAEMGRIPYEFYHTSVKMKPGAESYLNELHRAGVRMCVATATEEESARAGMIRAGLWDRFEFMLTCGGVGKGKDDPEIYLQCAGRFGVPPGEVAVFEDSLYCIRTAKRAGFRVIGVKDLFSEEDEREIALLCEDILDFGRASEER